MPLGVSTDEMENSKILQDLRAGSSLRRRVGYSLAIVRLILVPVIFLSVYYLFAMGRIVDRIGECRCPGSKAGRTDFRRDIRGPACSRNYVLFQDPEYLRANQESLMKVRQTLVRIGDLEPDEETIVQKDLDAVNRYEQRFASAVSTLGQSSRNPSTGFGGDAGL